MPADVKKTAARKDPFLDELARLQAFGGSPAEFWPAFLATTGGLLDASRLLLLRQDGETGKWKKLGDWTGRLSGTPPMQNFLRQLEVLAGLCLQEGQLCQALDETPESFSGSYAVGLTLRPSANASPAVLIAGLQERNEAAAQDALRKLKLAAMIPGNFQHQDNLRQAKDDVERFARVLDLMVQVQSESRFLGAAMAFCNGTATHLGCERVSLGWLQKGYVRLSAISRMERFDRKMEVVGLLEKAMEESLDQDDEVVWPPLETSVITRDHQGFAERQKVAHVCSVPLRVDQKPVGVLTCERQDRPFTEQELHHLRLACDVAVAPLASLKKQDRWFGHRWMEWSRENAAQFLGPQHTLLKVSVIAGTLLLATLVFGKTNYRVEGNFQLHSDSVSYIAVPFDGYIQEVLVRPGDQVGAGDPVLKLSMEDLKLEESAAMAEVNRYKREMEKARAAQLSKSANAVAELRIAQTLVEQAQARLDLVRHRLGEAVLKAGFAGVVVEGDLRERLGAPVREGEVLFKIARVDQLYVEVDVPERDIHEVRTGSKAEVALVTQPHLKFPVKVDLVEPSAIPKENQNVFRVRCSLLEAAPEWWRPGMTGACKIEAGSRSWLWILTHRTVDFLRMKLWW